MDINFLKNMSFILAAVLLAGILVRKYRRFFEWEKTDSWQTFIQRAVEEQRKDRLAQRLMFGSLSATNRANLINFFVLLGFSFFLARVPALLMWSIGYLAIGFFVSRRAAFDARTVEHGRLSFSDRLWIRLYFSLGWPFLLWRNKKTDI